MYCHTSTQPTDYHACTDSVRDEMAHVISWANENKMAVNLLKTVELVFHRPNVSHDLSPLAMSNVSRIDSEAFRRSFET